MKKILNNYLILSLLIALSTSACAKHNGIQTGKGSWYGKKFHGRLTANGEKYNMYALTAAHKTLPFNTMVEVTNLSNNRKVVVRINDRGPYAKGRIIDLSYLAAKKLGYVNKGVAKLKVKVLYKRKKK
ncbi:MAG TPA: septal ring lytic transglycosylase RlpA family protein [candidate division WWE3 bacterium]|uniref:Probable endolytic peptidoglycan transglycosylase RlpA n=1 Tax=candidate division WWE3 bacterium TaxID=2053526 RepID=A0A7V5J046_UNCKA|nr:septal ring lytic transglycosylase RlpA family protein [candidate division WWE3 bacterium]